MTKVIQQQEQLTLLGEAIKNAKRESYGRMAYRLSKVAKQALEVRMTQEGYGLRGKSRWTQEAIEAFTAQTPGIWQRIVIDTEQYSEPLSPDAVNLTDELRVKLWRASIDAALYGSELDEPVYLEISIASVIRAAIMWRLGKEPGWFDGPKG